jgi:transcriptional regulator with XRE-family HTH domain
MPRPNKRREIFAEDHLAQRIAAERDARGWTNDGLAKRMTDAGCPMTGSAIFKIEKAQPRRRIVVDELVTFAKVFAVPMEELLLPPEIAAKRDITRLVTEMYRAIDAERPLTLARKVAVGELLHYSAEHPETAKMIGQIMDDLPHGDE